MGKDNNGRRKILLSSDGAARLLACNDLYWQMREQLKRLLLSKTENAEVAKALLQQTYLNWSERLSAGPLSCDTIPEGYLMTIARNLANDWHSQQNKLFPMPVAEPKRKPHEVTERTLEEWREQVWEERDIRNLVLRIPNERYRVLGILRYLTELTAHQIHLVTGWSLEFIYKGTHRFKQHLRRMWEHKDNLLTSSHPWERQFDFTKDNGPICVNLLNVFPQNIHPACLENILNELEVNTQQELFEKYAAFLRIEGVEFSGPTLRITFIERESFRKGPLYTAEPINYIDFFVDFTTDGRGVEKRVEFLKLTRKLQYSGQTQEPICDKQSNWIGVELEFKSLGLRIRKALTEEFLYHQYWPNSKRTTTHVYQAVLL